MTIATRRLSHTCKHLILGASLAAGLLSSADLLADSATGPFPLTQKVLAENPQLAKDWKVAEPAFRSYLECTDKDDGLTDALDNANNPRLQSIARVLRYIATGKTAKSTDEEGIYEIEHVRLPEDFLVFGLKTQEFDIIRATDIVYGRVQFQKGVTLPQVKKTARLNKKGERKILGNQTMLSAFKDKGLVYLRCQWASEYDDGD